MLSATHRIPTLDKTGKVIGYGSLATGFSRASHDYEVPARPWNLGMVLEVGSAYLVYSVSGRPRYAGRPRTTHVGLILRPGLHTHDTYSAPRPISVFFAHFKNKGLAQHPSPRLVGPFVLHLLFHHH